MQSGKAVIQTVFGAHFLKEVSRAQLESAAKSLLPPHIQQQLRKADKGEYVIPLAKAFLRKGIIKLSANADFKSLTRENIKKVGTF